MTQYFVREIASHPYCDAQGYHVDYAAYVDDDIVGWTGYVGNPAEHADWRVARKAVPTVVRSGWIDAATPTSACQSLSAQRGGDNECGLTK